MVERNISKSPWTVRTMNLIENWQIRVGLVRCSCIRIVQTAHLYFIIGLRVRLRCTIVLAIRGFYPFAHRNRSRIGKYIVNQPLITPSAAAVETMLFLLFCKMAATDSTTSKDKSTLKNRCRKFVRLSLGVQIQIFFRNFCCVTWKKLFLRSDLSASLRVCNSGAGALLNTLPIY